MTTESRGRPPKAAWRARRAERAAWRPARRIEVLVDLNDKVADGQGRRVPARAARLHAPRQDDRHRSPRRRAAAHRRRPGHRQDHDGAPDGAQRRSGGQANVLYICFEHDELYLLNRLIAVESALAHLPAQDRRDQDPGRPQGDPGHVDGPGRRRRPAGAPTRGCGRRSTASPATARTCSCCAARRPRARSTTSAQLVQQHRELSGDRRLMVFVDYLQKVPVDPGARRPRPRRSPSSSTASRTSRCPRTCR